MSIATSQTALAADAQKLKKGFYLGHMTTQAIDNIKSDVPAYITLNSSKTILVEIPDTPLQSRDVSSDWAAADITNSAIIAGAYIYLLICDTGTNAFRIYRYDKTNLAAGGTLMTMSGQAFGTNNALIHMTVDSVGTTFYITGKANASANYHVVSKYTLSGTTLTYVADITCGSTAANLNNIVTVDSSGNIYGFNYADSIIRKYNSSGTLQTTYVAYPGMGTGVTGGFHVLMEYVYACQNLGNAMQFVLITL